MIRISLAFVLLLLVSPAQAQLRGHGGPVRGVAVSAQRQVLFRGDAPVDAAERAGNALRDILVTHG